MRKHLSRRERKELARREQNRNLRLIKSSLVKQRAQRIGRVKVKTFAMAAGGTGLVVQEPAEESGVISVSPANDDPPPSGVLHAVPSRTTSAAVETTPVAETKTVLSSSRLPRAVKYYVNEFDELGDEAAVWDYVLSGTKKKFRSGSRSSPQMEEKRRALMRAVADYLDATHGSRDRFSKLVFNFEGKLLRQSKVIIEEGPSEPPSSSQVQTRQAIRDAVAREKALVAALEATLLQLIGWERARSRDERIQKWKRSLAGFAQRLWISRYTGRVDELLKNLALGEDAMRYIQNRLGRVMRFKLYANPSGSNLPLGWPTSQGIHVWGLMRQRLLRGSSRLAQVLMKKFGP